LGAKRLLNRDERKKLLRRGLKTMDVWVDESILGLADEALLNKYEAKSS
jgi:hypothetical protein